MERKFQNLSQALTTTSDQPLLQFFYPTLENANQIDALIEIFLQNTFDPIQVTDIPHKRGRKKLRPFNPTKTEIMDKFWIRGFKEFMNLNLNQLRNGLEDLEFWEFFLGKFGDPGKKRKHLSYGREYKRFLFGNKSFCKVFMAWAVIYGSLRLPKKNFRGSWELHFEYLCTELIQPCKMEIDKKGFKESLELLSTVYCKYLSYVEKHLNAINANFIT